MQSVSYIFEVTVIDQLHHQQDVDEELGLRVLNDLLSTQVSAVEHILDVLTLLERRGLARQLQSLVEVGQVVAQHQHGVAQGVELAQLFELFG